tara:strand:+ start:2315 stop:2470 length:156 start_codon:yes stop_codon:yes gene_type:complete
MPSLILHIDEIIENTFKISSIKALEKIIIDIIEEELEAKKTTVKLYGCRAK